MTGLKARDLGVLIAYMVSYPETGFEDMCCSRISPKA